MTSPDVIMMMITLSIFLLVVSSREFRTKIPSTPKQNAVSKQASNRSSPVSRKRKLNFTALYVVELTNENDVKSLVLANSGLTFVSRIFDDEALYLFGFDESRSAAINFTDSKKSGVKGKWMEQSFFERQKRRLENGINENHVDGPLFNDPLYQEQWYLHSSKESSELPLHQTDINVLPVWRAGITGASVRISVLDDGVCRQNPEVTENYDGRISYDYINFGRVEDVQNAIAENSHGTYCAAIAAGTANNKYCGIGVAFGAKVGGVRVLDGPVTDAQEAMSLINALDYVDIYTASWGPKDDGRHIGGPGPLAQRALEKGILKGRKGKGSVYVWAAGNGGGNCDNCNLDGYASSPYTLTFGALAADGRSTFYSEPCSAVIASVFVGGLHHPPSDANFAAYKHMTKVIVPDGRGKCRKNFQGTSAAAPIASGVIALLIEANPSLTWRDIQHIIVETSRIPSLFESGWSFNAAGKHFHPKVGFGALDAAAAVDLALKWKTVGHSVQHSTKPFLKKRFIMPSMNTTVRVKYETTADVKAITAVETVVAKLNIRHPLCGFLQIYLTSPSGTTSQILSRRPLDNFTTAIRKWDFVTLHFWGENPIGEWSLQIVDERPLALTSGFIDYLRLKFFGTYKPTRSSFET